MKKTISILALSLLFAGGFLAANAQAAPLDLTGWAWSSNTGWLSFNSANAGSGGGNYKVTAATSTQSPGVAAFSGYAWSSNIGWVSFSSSETGCPSSEASFDKPVSQGGTGADLPYGVGNICAPRVDLNTGKVSGWARVLSIKAEDSTSGWLHLSGTNHPTGSGGVSYNKTTGAFTGYAYEPSAIGWMSFAASSPAPGVNICVNGTPNCPPVVVNPTCSIGTITISGDDVLIPIDLPSGIVNYSLNRDGVEVDRSNNDEIIVDSGLALIPGTYVYQIVKSSDGSICGSPKTFTVTNNPPPPPPQNDDGIKLLIGSPTVSFSTTDYDDTSDFGSNGKSYRVVKGRDFRLQWNVSPNLAPGYNQCVGIVDPINGPTGNWGNLNSQVKYAVLDTAGVSTGTYIFTLTCSGNNLPDKTSSVQLRIVSSILEET